MAETKQDRDKDTTVTTPLTPREVRVAREAYIQGVRDFSTDDMDWKGPVKEAALRYPMPTVTRPRIEKAGDYRYRLTNGVVECQSVYTENKARWVQDTTALELTHAINKLLASPTETVEVDDD